MLNKPPFVAAIVNTTQNVSMDWIQWLDSVWLYVSPIGQSGTTAKRPVKQLFIGRPYFDTTLGYSINVKTVSPAVWVNGAGSTV